MAKIKCPVCGREISDKAKVCLGCATPMPKILDAINHNKPVDNELNQGYMGLDEDVCDFAGIVIADEPKESRITLDNITKMTDEDGFVLYFSVKNYANEARKIYLSNIKIDEEDYEDDLLSVGTIRAKDEEYCLTVPFYDYPCDTYYDLEFDVKINNAMDKELSTDRVKIHIDFEDDTIDAHTLIPNANFVRYVVPFLKYITPLFGKKQDDWMEVFASMVIENWGFCSLATCTKEQIFEFFGQKVAYDYRIFVLPCGIVRFCTPLSIRHNAYDDKFLDNVDRNHLTCAEEVGFVCFEENGQPYTFMCVDMWNIPDAFKLIINSDESSSQEEGIAMLKFLFADDIWICEEYRKELIAPYKD